MVVILILVENSGGESDNSLESFASDGKSVDAGDIGDINNDDLVDELDDGDLEYQGVDLISSGRPSD